MTSIPGPTARAWADIDLGALRSNGQTVARVSGSQLLPMVKANGYGLGALACVRALDPLEPWGYGVATVEEGVELRAQGVNRPILVFTPLLPALVPSHVAHDLRPVIGDADALRAWLAAGPKPFHVEVDTGMSRSGFRWDADLSWRELLPDQPGFEGAFTHFHSADTDPASVERQWQRFQAVLQALPVRPALTHAANSAAALHSRAYACSLVRPGIFLYGGEAGGHKPRPVVNLRCRVVGLREVRSGDTVSYGATWTAPRDTRVATLAIGYADGVLCSLGNQGLVEINGRVAPLIGRVTMDSSMIEVDGPCELGDVATVFGGMVSVDEQARRAGTIAYELLTAMGPRVPRRYDADSA
jgi:alanine racemase